MSAPRAIVLNYRVDAVLFARASQVAAKSVRRGVLGWLQMIVSSLPWFALPFLIFAVFSIVHHKLTGERARGTVALVYIVLALLSNFGVVWLSGRLLALNLMQSREADPAQMTIDSSGIRIEAADALTVVGWPAIDKVVAFTGGIAFVSGALVHYAPEGSLPEGMSKQDAIDLFEGWRKAAVVFG